MNIFEDELKRLNLEDWIFIIFIFVALMNIFGDQLLKKYVKQNNIKDLKNADKIFLTTLTITLIAYLYFMINRHIFQTFTVIFCYVIMFLCKFYL